MKKKSVPLKISSWIWKTFKCQPINIFKYKTILSKNSQSSSFKSSRQFEEFNSKSCLYVNTCNECLNISHVLFSKVLRCKHTTNLLWTASPLLNDINGNFTLSLTNRWWVFTAFRFYSNNTSILQAAVHTTCFNGSLPKLSSRTGLSFIICTC